MDQSNKILNQPNETQKKAKVFWRGELLTKTFLEACIEEVTANGRLGSNLKPHSWVKVGEILKKTHNFEVDARQMRNRYDYLKKLITSKFTFVWAGWEGVAHDSRILTEVALDPLSGFPVPPPNKYYLCDAAYTNTRGYMTPYRNIRYWLADFRRRRALSKEEKFNHAHAKLRNVIERAYGVLKARFPILKQMAPYSFSTQRDIVIACIAVHNFIRKKKLEDELFDRCDQMSDSDSDGEEVEEDFEGSINDTQWGSQATQYMNDLRDQIAMKL